MQNDQDGSGHCSDNGEAHEEMRYALLYDALGDDFLLPNLTAVVRLDDFEYAVIIGHAVRVRGSLRYESVWQRDVDDAGNEACTAEKEEVPMEAARFLEWELFRLRRDAALVLQSLFSGISAFGLEQRLHGRNKKEA